MTVQLVQGNTPVTGSINFVVEGKPRPSPQDVAQLARILADAGIEVADRETAPPEFWRSLLDAEPILTDSHYDAATKKYASTGVREVKVRRALIRELMEALDLGLLAEEDRELLLDLDATTNGSITFPPHRAETAYTLIDSFKPMVRECSIVVNESTVRLTPLPVVGKVRIPKDKLDGIKVDLKGENPRLERINKASLLAQPAALLAEARRGSSHPKDDADEDKGDKIETRCPTVAHEDKRPSAWVCHYPDGFGGGCPCGGWSSSLPGLILAYSPRLSWDQACERAEQILGLPPWGEASAGEIVVGDELQALAALAPAPPPAPVPTVNHIVSWLRKQLAVGVAEESWMVSRALNPAVQARCILSRSPAPRTTPAWDGIEIGDEAYLAEAAENAAKTGHTLITLTFDEKYQPAGVRFRRTMGTHKAKTKTPTVYRNKKLISMPQRGVGLNNVAVRAGQGKTPWPEWTVIVEGEPDMRTAAELYPAAAVVEIHRGKSAWTKAFADTLPSGIKVAILTDTDKIGRKYRRDVIRSLGKRVQFYDFPGRVHDLNQLLQDGKRADLDLANLKQIPVGEEREHTDLGNAHRLHDEYFGELAYSAGRWYVLKDGVWERQDKDALEVRRRIQAIAEGIVEEAEIVASEEGAKATLWWGKKSQSSGAVTACLTEAKVLFSVGEDVFDKDPFLIGVPNGVVDLRTGELLEDLGAAMVSQRIHVAFDPSATCPRWLKFLDEIFLGDVELIEYMRQCVGYFLTASTREECFWIWHGKRGGNGKGTLLKILGKLLGPLAAPKRASLVCRREGQPSWDLSSLEGLRLAYINEAPPGGIVSVETLKNIASSDDLYGEKKGVDPKSYPQTHKLVWTLNDRPNVPHDPAVLRRLRLVPFDACFQEKPDLELFDKLLAELAGILAWGVSGAVAWYKAGRLRAPAKVIAAGKQFAEESDHVGRWIEDECEVAPDIEQERTRLHTRFAEWAARQKVRALSPSNFYGDLEKKGFEQRKVRGDRFFRGIRLTPLKDGPVDWRPPPLTLPPSSEQIDSVIEALDKKEPGN